MDSNKLYMEKRTLAKNSIYNVIYRLLNVFFPLMTATYIARILLAKGVGQVSFAQNIVSYYITIAALGIPNYGIREIAKVRSNVKLTSELFTDLISINFISTIVCIIVYYSMITFLEFFKKNIFLYAILGLSIVFNIINVDWFYQGVEEYEYIVKRSLFVKVFMLIAIFIFVKTEKDTIVYAIIYCLGIGGNHLFNILNLRKYGIKLSIKNISIKKHLNSIFILLTSSIAIELYTMVDTTMIGVMCKDENVGYYANAMKLVRLLISVIAAIGSVLLPRLSFYHKQGKDKECSIIVSEVLSVLLILFIPSEIGVFLLSDQIMILLFGSSFKPGIITLRISSLLICTLGFSNLFGTQVLLTYGAEKKLLKCTICGAIINIMLNSILIPYFAQNGAAVSSVISESVVTLLTFIFALRFVEIKINKKVISSIVVSSIGMVGMICLIRFIFLNSNIELLLSIIVGGMAYLTLNILIKNPVIIELWNLIKNSID